MWVRVSKQTKTSSNKWENFCSYFVKFFLEKNYLRKTFLDFFDLRAWYYLFYKKLTEILHFSSMQFSHFFSLYFRKIFEFFILRKFRATDWSEFLRKSEDFNIFCEQTKCEIIDEKIVFAKNAKFSQMIYSFRMEL